MIRVLLVLRVVSFYHPECFTLEIQQEKSIETSLQCDYFTYIIKLLTGIELKDNLNAIKLLISIIACKITKEVDQTTEKDK